MTLIVMMAVMGHFSANETDFIYFAEGDFKMVKKWYKSFLYVTLWSCFFDNKALTMEYTSMTASYNWKLKDDLFTPPEAFYVLYKYIVRIWKYF